MCSVLQTDPRVRRRSAFALGSNSGDRLGFLERACDCLTALFGDLRLSRVYETEPVGCPPGSSPFLNACVEVLTDMPPLELLRHGLEIENRLGRVRSGVYGEPRTCDIDLLYSGELMLSSPELTLPHPRIRERRFVLQPLCDIDPELILPGQRVTVRELLAALPPTPAVTPFAL